MKRSLLFLPLILTLSVVPQAQAIDSINVAPIFDQLTAGANLANPSVVLIDESTGQIAFEKNPYSLRKPASIMKLYTGAAALTHLDPKQRFDTSLWVGVQSKSLVIQGSFDPWISLLEPQATKMKRTSLPHIESKALRVLRDLNGKRTRNATIYYAELYAQEVSHIKRYLAKRGLRATMKQISPEEAQQKSHYMVTSYESPELQTMLAFALTWSDNVLAERIARLAARKAGYPRNDSGVALLFSEVLSGLGIPQGNQIIKDASGLSKENRVSAMQVAQLLVQLKRNSQFAPLIGGLPVGGVSGTLRHRFIETAPQAIGLVKAKSGSLNGTVNLAGYVEAGDREYIFVIIADRLRSSNRAEKLARTTVDRILGKIAAPLLPAKPNQTDGSTDNSELAITS